MTAKKKQQYQAPDQLRKVFNQILGKKFRLDCGHHVTVGRSNLANDFIVRTGKTIELICLECGR